MISFRFCPCPQGGPKEDRDFGNTVQVGSALSADGMRPVARKYGNWSWWSIQSADYTDYAAAIRLGSSQYHLAVAGGCEAFTSLVKSGFARYREVVLTASKFDCGNLW